MPDEDSEPGLHVEFTETAEAELTEAYQWLWKFGYDTAERWLNGIVGAIEGEARNLASPIIFRRAPITQGNPYPDRVIYTFLYRPNRRGTAWKVYYELRDEDADGIFDTLRIMKVRHASAQ